jgi:hypothetical protein
MSEQVTTTTVLEAVLAMDAYYHAPDTGNTLDLNGYSKPNNDVE